jgi:hypothetical protein
MVYLSFFSQGMIFLFFLVCGFLRPGPPRLIAVLKPLLIRRVKEPLLASAFANKGHRAIMLAPVGYSPGTAFIFGGDLLDAFKRLVFHNGPFNIILLLEA